MNKTILIAGGASVVSLAAGAAGGYFYAKKKFEAELDEKITVEVEKTKKYFSIMLMEARQAKPETPADIPPSEPEEPEELSEEQQEAVDEAAKALTNYQGYAQNPQLGEVARNIFDTSERRPKKSLPPRDPATGHFLPKNGKTPEQTPYLITEQEFLENEPEHDQENLLYFVRDKTLIQVMDREEVDIGRVGEVSLTLFPEAPKGEPSTICVRNEGLQMDYEILLTHDSLTEFMGLGEDDDPDGYAGEALYADIED